MKVGTDWKFTCDFLLVFYCYYMPVFCCLQDARIYWSKVCVFWTFLYTQSRLKLSQGGFPGTIGYWKFVSKQWALEMRDMDMYQLFVKTAWSNKPLCSHGTGVWQTDGQTDKQTAPPTPRIAERDLAVFLSVNVNVLRCLTPSLSDLDYCWQDERGETWTNGWLSIFDIIYHYKTYRCSRSWTCMRAPQIWANIVLRYR